jgi:hypothetical protein
MRTRIALSCALVLLAAGLLTSLAAAGEVSRASYKEAAEPICKQNTEANERIFQGVRAEVKAGKLKPAATKFARAAQALKQTIAQLKSVPRPAADSAKLGKWLADVGLEANLFEAIAAKLRAGNKGSAEHLVVKLTSNANKANNVVLAFEFEYCRFEPSRFT